MSLVIGVVQKDFIIVSSDSALTVWPHDEEVAKKTGKYIKTGEVTNAGLKSKKVYKLTDKVLVTTCGSVYLTQLILSELRYYIKNDYDLSKCKEIAKKVMKNVSEGIYFNKKLLFKTLREEYKLTYFQTLYLKKNFNKYFQSSLPGALEAKNLITSFSMHLIGFNNDGTSGSMEMREGTTCDGPLDNNSGYPAIIEGDRIEYLQFLNLPVGERNIETFANRMSLIHARISKDNPINVSADCNFYVLIKEQDSITHRNFSIDTTEIQRTFN